MTTLGIYRRLTQCSDAAHTFSILALDHRDNLVAELQKHQSAPVTYGDVRAFKTSVARAAGAASAILLDPDYGMPLLSLGIVPGRLGLLAPLEVTDYRPHPRDRKPRLIPDWGVEKLARAGVAGAKLLVYYHPDASDAGEKTALVDHIAEECRAHDIPLFLEPIAYSLDPARHLDNRERRRVVVENARHFSRRGATVMKMEFPIEVTAEPDERVWVEALEELNAACEGPWALLSAGMPFDVFLRQTVLACQAGASGVIAGRAVWTEAVSIPAAERAGFADEVVRQRLERLAAVCRALATPWTYKLAAPALSERWYASPVSVP